MPDPGTLPLADVMSSFSSVVVILLLGVVLLVLWQLAIVLGAVIANLRRRARHETGGPVEVG